MKEKCKNCANPSKACISYLMTLSTYEMLQWCLMWKKRFGWSNATFAKKSGVPKGTVDRNMNIAKGTDDSKGANMATIRPLICAITGCTMEELEACDGITPIALMERAEKAEQECERLKSVMDKMTADRRTDIDAAHADDQTKISYLKERVEYLKGQISFKEEQMKAKDKLLEERYEFMKRKDRIIAALAIALSIAVLVIIAALVIDKLNPDMGFLWVDRMSTWFEGTTEITNHFASRL